MSCSHSLCAPLSRENSHHASRISLDSHSLWEYIFSAYQRNHAESAAAGFLIQAFLGANCSFAPSADSRYSGSPAAANTRHPRRH
jgi:hypothetical protein